MPAATLAGAGVLCFATFEAGGGLALERMTIAEMALTIGAGALITGALLAVPWRARAYGVWPLALLLAMAALTALSVTWSVAPDASWQDAGRMLAYSGVFATAVAAARVAPRGWSALLGAVVLASVVVCVYALLTKVLPAQLDAQNVYARLQQPYGYWNAIGLTAALGAIGCLWLGARRAGHAAVSAMAYPAMGLMLVVLMLAYSRGALAALAIGVALWMLIVPLRLRAARVLIVGALGAAPVVAWDFSQHALTSDGVALSTRGSAGHQLGVLLVAMLLALGAAGVAIGFFGGRRAPSPAARRRAGVLLIGLLVVALAGGVAALAMARRGLTGTISHNLSALTDPNAPLPKNTPGRLTSLGSVRARYWKEALEIFKAHPALGAGAGGYETARLRYKADPRESVRQAHGYIVQTMADLGIVGLSVTLALLAAWLAAAARCTRPLNRRLVARRRPAKLAGRDLVVPIGLSWRRTQDAYTPERLGLLSMLCIVVVFGVHSFADWTWYVPGNACVALLCGGWLVGRGPLSAPERQAGVSRPDLRRAAIAAAVLATALAAAWTEWQPQRSAQDSERALALLARDPQAARAAAQSAVSEDPLSAVALFKLSAVQHARGEAQLARATLQKAVRLQPSNFETWQTLGEYDLPSNPRAAANELRAAVYLNPQSIPTQNAYVEALRAASAGQATGGTALQGGGASASGAATANRRAAARALRSAGAAH